MCQKITMYIQKKVNELLAKDKTSAKKSVTAITKEVIEGKWGNGEERKKKTYRCRL